MKEKHQATIDNVTSGLTRLTSFLTKYTVPDCLSVLTSSLEDKQLHFYHNLRWDNEKTRDKNLAECGEAFGTNGWESNQTSVTDFTWKKVVDDVLIELAGAKSMPEPKPQPVAPREFPVLLMDMTVAA